MADEIAPSIGAAHIASLPLGSKLGGAFILPLYYLLLESGDELLLEDGTSKLLLEG